MNPNDNITQENFERIERYLSHEMVGEERLVFEKQLQQDAILQKHLEENTILFEAIETQSLKEQLNTFHDAIPEKEASKVRYLQFRKIAVAAAIVIAAGSFWFFNNTSSNQKLYATYFKPDPGLATTMGKSDNFEFYDAMVNYKQGDYKTAISKWETLLESKPQNDTLNYFLGVAYLANKNENLAIQYLNKVTQNPQTAFKNESFHYLGLAHLKAENIELAKKNLTFSTQDNSKALLSKLND